MSTDGKVPPPRRPAMSGGAASRPPAPTPGGRPATALVGSRPAPARPAPAPAFEPEDDAKTQAFSIADMGLDDDGDEKTTAFNFSDLPPEDAPSQGRQPQRTLVGHPVSPSVRPAPVRSAPVRSAAPPAPSRPAPAAAAPAQDEATVAMNVDAMLAAMDDDGDEKTSAMSLDEIEQLEASKKARMVAKATPSADLIGANDKTHAVTVADVRDAFAAPAPKPAAPKATATAASAPGSKSGKFEVPSKDGFFGAIQYFFSFHAIKARADRGEIPRSAVDSAAAQKGLINTAVIGGGILVLTLVAGLLK